MAVGLLTFLGVIGSAAIVTPGRLVGVAMRTPFEQTALVTRFDKVACCEAPADSEVSP